MDEQSAGFSWSKVEDLLNFAPATPTATLKVNHDNVLAAAKVIQSQIDSLSQVVDVHGPALIVDAAADDPVSRDVANAWNYRLVGAEDSYSARISDYVNSLLKLMSQLRDSAKTYGFSDQDIAGSFGTTVV
jgi:hypothetical protein